MKKLILAALLILGMSIMFSSCDKTDESINKKLVGCWALYYEDDGELKLDWRYGYVEYTKDGLYNVYFYSEDEDDEYNFDAWCEINFHNGILSYPRHAKKYLDQSWSYDIRGGQLTAGGYTLGKITVINKDHIEYSSDGDKMVLYRVKEFSAI